MNGELEQELEMWGASPEQIALILKAVDSGGDVTPLLEKYCPGLIEDTAFQQQEFEEQQYQDIYGSDYGIDSFADGIL